MKSKAGKIIFWSLLVGAVAAGAIIVYRKLSVKDADDLAAELAEKAKQNPTPDNIRQAQDAKVTAAASNNVGDGFPLRRGSNNSLVKNMQQALMDSYGKADTLPRYGADGIFGSETESALTRHGFPAVITQAHYNNIVAGKSVNGSPVRNATTNYGPFAAAYQVGPDGANIKMY